MLAYDSFLRDRGGACLLAVCRGKVRSHSAHDMADRTVHVHAHKLISLAPPSFPVCVREPNTNTQQVSEGMDFADHRARAVVITGIPFAPAKDPKARATAVTSFFIEFSHMNAYKMGKGDTHTSNHTRRDRERVSHLQAWCVTHSILHIIDFYRWS